jgi:hypothetical protein
VPGQRFAPKLGLSSAQFGRDRVLGLVRGTAWEGDDRKG